MTLTIITNAALALIVAIAVVGLLANAIRRSHPDQRLLTLSRRRRPAARPAVATPRRQAGWAARPETF